ncbi:RagB/SusD family nutrient uptake outer membrane protein [Bacteroides sp. KFT8]|jgi:hypothetical protein|uniref:RagB/SusD family nutrient uptake outer membrane protein n=1 Tax=Bacteroides sp. KFT8 TaxID=2025659 RepID=UPI000C053556|nr:RagB/SusD family nutrient uptake outer membrane protein [Bacteroides sp. KFT8]
MKIINSFMIHFMKIVLSVCLFSSCSYLDVVPPETADLDDTMKDREAALGFLYSCYSGVKENCANDGRGFEASADEFVHPRLWDNTGQRAAWNLLSSTFKPASGGYSNSDYWSSDIWRTSYNNLGQVHLFIKCLENLSPAGVTDSDKIRWKSEAIFLDAYYHFRVLAAYGPSPIITHWMDQNTSTTSLPGRSHFDYCIKYITDRLDEAAKNLPATVETADLGRATSTICKALKSRVLLYAASPLWNGSFPFKDWKNNNYETPGYGTELVSKSYDRKKWEDALQASLTALTFAENEGKRKLFNLVQSEQIRNNESVSLPYIPGIDDDEFKKRVVMLRYMLTAAETAGNAECIWGAYTNQEILKQSLPHYIVMLNGVRQSGFSGRNPLLYTVEHFYTKNGKLPKFDNQFTNEADWFNSANIPGHQNIINLNVKREPRFYAWLSFDGDEYSSKLANGSPLIIEARNSNLQGFNEGLYNRDNCVTGYFSKKYIEPGLNADKPSFGYLNKYPTMFIRLAELYLNIAECYAALDDKENAIKYLNFIRQRAGIAALEGSDITRDMNIMDWVHNERFIELWGEGHRYYDARRWMIAPEVFKSGVREGLNAIEKKDPSMEEFNKRIKVDQPFQWSDRMYLLPIYIDEYYSNPQLVQAPEY